MMERIIEDIKELGNNIDESIKIIESKFKSGDGKLINEAKKELRFIISHINKRAKKIKKKE